MNPKRGNRGVRTTLVLAGLLASSISLSSEAYAQAWLPDRAYTEGPGIRAGDLEIHPGIAVRGGYDTNVFRADDEARSAVINGQQVDISQRERGAAILAVTPHIHLSTLSEQRRTQGEDREEGPRSLPAVAFRGGLAATYYHYFIDNGPRNLEVDTDLWLGILPQRPFNVDLSLTYARNVRPFTQNAGDRNAYVYNLVQPRARFNFGSRSQVLTAYVGYAPRMTLFESGAFNYLNNAAHSVEAGSAWRFLPNTALVYDGNVDFQRFQDENPRDTVSPVVFANNTRFRTRLGVNGAITRTLSLRAMAGYAVIAFDDTTDSAVLDDHEDVVGEAVLGWRFGPGQTSQIDVGYQRDVLASALGGWTRLDRGFATLRSLLGRMVMLTLEGGVSGVSYGRLWGYDRNTTGEAVARDPGLPVPLGSNGETDRKDIRVDGAIHGEFRVTNWLSFLADFSVQTIITDFDYAVYFADSPVPDPADYITFMAFGGVRAHY